MVVPITEIFKEYLTVESEIIDHRSSDEVLGVNHKGWKSLTLHGVNKHITEDTDGIHTWTEIADKCSNTVEWIKDSFIFNEYTGRIRFMHLEPGGYILPHHDREQTGLREINVAIQQPKGCVFQFLERGVIPFSDGKVFIIDVSNKHMVYNNSNQMRLHMILHTDVSDELIERSYEKSYYST